MNPSARESTKVVRVTDVISEPPDNLSTHLFPVENATVALYNNTYSGYSGYSVYIYALYVTLKLLQRYSQTIEILTKIWRGRFELVIIN